MSKDKSSKKEIKQAVKVAKALDAAKEVKANEKVSKKTTKAQEKTAKKSSEYSRPLHQDGVFGGPGAQARARQRHFDSSGQTIVRHPGSMPDVPDVDGVIG